jgi:eukaryotic translation initiation factor 2C
MTKITLSAAPYKPILPIETSPDGKVYEGTQGQKCKVQVNYGVISFDQKNFPKTAYHYDVKFFPDLPKKMLPFALRTFMAQHFPTFIYGTDERKNLYTAQKLAINGSIVDSHEADAEAVMGDRRRMFKVTVKYAADVDLGVLLNYKKPEYQNEDKPSSAVQVLDIILRSAFNQVLESNKAIRAGRQVYFIPKQQMRLGDDGMELW